MTISRQYPTNLNLHLTNSTTSSRSTSTSTSRSTSNINYSERQWEEFCDGIDAILIHLASLHQSNSRISTLLLLVFMVALVLACSILFFQCLYKAKSKSKYNLFLLLWAYIIQKPGVAILIGVGVLVYGYMVCDLVNGSKKKEGEIISALSQYCVQRSSTCIDTRSAIISNGIDNSNGNGNTGVHFYLRRKNKYTYGKTLGSMVYYVEVRVDVSRLPRSSTPDTLASDLDDDDDLGRTDANMDRVVGVDFESDSDSDSCNDDSNARATRRSNDYCRSSRITTNDDQV